MMKNLLFFFISAMIILASCQSDSNTAEDSVEEVQSRQIVKPETAKVANAQPQEPTDTVNVAKLNFPEPNFLFGTVDEGEKVKHVFEFTNTGKVPLVISNARGSCGCTVPVWPKEPIAVGEKGEINVVFNTQGKKNQQTKTVTLTANTYPVNTVLKLKGTVTPSKTPAVDPNKKKELKTTTDAHNHDHDHGSHDGHNH